MLTSAENAGQVILNTLVIEAVNEVAEGVCSITLTPQTSGPLPSWEPGAHIDVYIPEIGARQYSLCGDPKNQNEWTIAVQLERDSRGGSKWMHRLSPGSRVKVGTPRNNFPLIKAERYFFIAGGIGITPILAMIKSLSPIQDWKLLYGGRSRSTMAFSQDLSDYGGAQVLLCPQDVNGIPDIASFAEDVKSTDAIYACGPPAMLREIERLSEKWPSGVLHLERFASRELTAPTTSSFEVVLARSQQSVRVEPTESIVSALSRIGVKVTTVCQEGVCGTCETLVLEGTPDHRDSVLSKEERAAGKTIMLCCSRSLTDRLVLDL